VRNQMGKESARPQALLYVLPKVCASAIWPFLKTSPHPATVESLEGVRRPWWRRVLGR
jgi:hypothetical protein